MPICLVEPLILIQPLKDLLVNGFSSLSQQRGISRARWVCPSVMTGGREESEIHNKCAFALFKNATCSRKLPGASNQQSWERGKRLLNGKGSPGVNDAVDENDSGALGLPSAVVIVGF